MSTPKSETKLIDFQPQRQNANKHSARGLGLLEDSIQRDGWLGAITVASDGETFDGSARLEVGANAGFSDAIIIDSDGSRPVVVRRTDIATADDPKAKRLGIAANRIAQIDLDWDTDVLADLVKEGADLSDLFTADEFTELVGEQETEAGEGGDEFDTTPDEEQTRVQVGDLWACGNHRVLCGDSTKAEDVARLMDGEKAALCFTSPPYNLGSSVGLRNGAFKGEVSAYEDDSDDDAGAWLTLMSKFTEIALGVSEYVLVNVQILSGNKKEFVWWLNTNAEKLADVYIWNKTNPQPAMAPRVSSSAFEFVVALTDTHKPTRAIGTAVFERGGFSNVFTSAVGNNSHTEGIHGATFPVQFAEHYLSNLCGKGAAVYEPFCGSGTTLIAAERTNRKCYGIEISPKYVNVILSRYEKETGQTAELLERHE